MVGPGHATTLLAGYNRIKSGIQEVVISDNLIKCNQEVATSDKEVHSSTRYAHMQ